MKIRYSMPPAIGFQMAPMLDIVFLLLVFFVVTQKIALTEQDLKVKVPTAEAPQDDQKSRRIDEIIVNVRKDGVVTINRQNFTIDQLYPKLIEITKGDGDGSTPIRIRGDAETPYQNVVDVLDTCLKAGIWNISFSTKKPNSATGQEQPQPSKQ